MKEFKTINEWCEYITQQIDKHYAVLDEEWFKHICKKTK